MLGKTFGHVPVFPPVIGGGITRGQMVLITALPRTGLPKSDLTGHLARRLYIEGKWSKEQFEEFCQLRQRQLDPLGLESHSLKESNKDV